MKKSTLNRFAAEAMKTHQLESDIRKMEHALGLAAGDRERKRLEQRLAIFREELHGRTDRRVAA